MAAVLPQFKPIDYKDYTSDVAAINQQNQLAPLETEAKRQQLMLAPDLAKAQDQQYQTEIAQGPLDRTAAQQKGGLATIQYGNDRLAQVALDAKNAATPADQERVFNDGMQKLADEGNAQARQYVGHYSDDLADRLRDAYGPKSTTPTEPNQDKLAQYEAFSKMTPEQRAQGLAHTNRLIDLFNGINTEADWNRASAEAEKMGVPVPHTGNWQRDYTVVHNQMLQQVIPQRDALMQFQTSSALGIPAMQPELPSGHISAGTQTYQAKYNAWLSAHPGDTQGALTYAGGTGGAGRTSAGAATFNAKRDAWLAAHPDDTQGALEFAGGKSVPDVKVREAALAAARGEMFAEMPEFASDPGAPAAQAWLRKRAEEDYQWMKQGSGGGAQAAKPQNIAMQQAMQRVKDAKGAPVTFANGQIWRLINGKPMLINGKPMGIR